MIARALTKSLQQASEEFTCLLDNITALTKNVWQQGDQSSTDFKFQLGKVDIIPLSVSSFYIHASLCILSK
jgi:hypothetical protein